MHHSCRCLCVRILICCHIQVCVVDRTYLQKIEAIEFDNLQSWDVDGYVLKATKFIDRTAHKKVDPGVVLEVTADEIGIELECK